MKTLGPLFKLASSAILSAAWCSSAAWGGVANFVEYKFSWNLYEDDGSLGAMITRSDFAARPDSEARLSITGANAFKMSEGFATLMVDSSANGSASLRKLGVRTKVHAVANPIEQHTGIWAKIIMESEGESKLDDQVTVRSPGATGNGTVKFTWEMEGMHEVNWSYIWDRAFRYYVVHDMRATTKFIWGSATSTATTGGVLFSETTEVGNPLNLPAAWPRPFVPQRFEIEVPVTFGESTAVSFSLKSDVFAGLLNLDGGDNFDVLSEANFGNTAALQLVEVFDGSGNKLVDATIESLAGISYLAAPVPEPSSRLLAGLGMISVLIAGGWRRRRASALDRCRG